MTLRGEPTAWILAHKNYEGDDCLIWPFSRDKDGYARIHGAVVSRFICQSVYGSPPSPKCDAAHSCHNGAGGCVNPRHLRWATRRENEADKVANGTVNIGARHGMAKLKDDDVRQIRKMLGPYRIIAEKFGISMPTVSEIKNRKTWAHIND